MLLQEFQFFKEEWRSRLDEDQIIQAAWYPALIGLLFHMWAQLHMFNWSPIAAYDNIHVYYV